MVPEKPVLGSSREAIGEVTAWRNWVLCDTWYTVHLRSSSLQKSMPMNRGFDVQVILDKNFNIVSLVNVNQRAWLLAIDKVHFTLKSIRRIGSAVNSEIELA